MNNCMVLCRRKEFQLSFGHIAEIRALVPPGTPYMAAATTGKLF